MHGGKETMESYAAFSQEDKIQHLEFFQNMPLYSMNAINVWNIDTGAAFKGKLSGVNIDTKAVYQSDNLPLLYPNEKGRNK